MKVLFSSFLKNGHTAWFDPHTKKLEPHCITIQTALHESTKFQGLTAVVKGIKQMDAKIIPCFFWSSVGLPAKNPWSNLSSAYEGSYTTCQDVYKTILYLIGLTRASYYSASGLSALEHKNDKTPV